MSRNGFALILLLLVGAMALAGGLIWYYAAHQTETPQGATSQNLGQSSRVESLSDELFYVSSDTLYVFESTTQTTSTVLSGVREVYGAGPYIVATNAKDGKIWLYDPTGKKTQLLPAAFSHSCWDGSGHLYPMSYSSSSHHLVMGCYPYEPFAGREHPMVVFTIGTQTTSLIFGAPGVGGQSDNPDVDWWSPDGTRLAFYKTTSVAGVAETEFYNHNLEVIDFSGSTTSIKADFPVSEDGCYGFDGWISNTTILCNTAYSRTDTFALNIDTLATSSIQVPPKQSSGSDESMSASGQWAFTATSAGSHSCAATTSLVRRVDGSERIALGPIDDCGAFQFVWYPTNTDRAVRSYIPR